MNNCCHAISNTELMQNCQVIFCQYTLNNNCLQSINGSFLTHLDISSDFAHKYQFCEVARLPNFLLSPPTTTVTLLLTTKIESPKIFTESINQLQAKYIYPI
ncbi:hypothetical protein GYH30_045899 [Glycine max]|uniref:Uncharacterized protein n=1 Tax=Glycine max TaxID=3847 RepID=K7MJE9_SOYBN|nr:hypothetical protein GYH30_045899 [Glycine max]